MVSPISQGKRKTRKPRQCFHCYRPIPKGEIATYWTNKDDGRVETFYSHMDCDAAWNAYCIDAELHWSDFPDGYPPLADEWSEYGEFENLCAGYRGQFPHVICRLEFHEQKAALRLGEAVYA